MRVYSALADWRNKYTMRKYYHVGVKDQVTAYLEIEFKRNLITKEQWR